MRKAMFKCSHRRTLVTSSKSKRQEPVKPLKDRERVSPQRTKQRHKP